MTNPPMDKVQIIERSLRCFWRSLAALVPLLGLPFAVHSLFAAHKLRRGAQGQWNPAEGYVKWSVFFGWLGILLSVAVAVPIGVYVWQQFSGGDSS
jgi:hypothetical protein